MSAHNEAMELMNKFPGVKVAFIGSNYVCNPPVMNTDIDILIYASPFKEKPKSVFRRITTETLYERVRHELERLNDPSYSIHNPKSNGKGYTPIGSYGDTLFMSYRKGDINYILTHDLDGYYAMKNAAEIAKILNLNLKEDRVAVAKYLIENRKNHA